MDAVSQLEKVLEFSNAMLERIKGGDWQGIIESEQQRQIMLQKCFEHPVESAQSREVAELINKILSVNQCISEVCQQQYASLRTVMSDIHRGRHAIKAYSEAQE